MAFSHGICYIVFDCFGQHDGRMDVKMNEKFFNLKKEKQDRLLNAAMAVFGENGYKRASTDEIVARAGVRACCFTILKTSWVFTPFCMITA